MIQLGNYRVSKQLQLRFRSASIVFLSSVERVISLLQGDERPYASDPFRRINARPNVWPVRNIRTLY